MLGGVVCLAVVEPGAQRWLLSSLDPKNMPDAHSGRR